jgi:heme/copper-type cytochrome/quinol oxidase subunit 3
MSEHQAVSPAPVAQRENAKVAIWLFLGSEVIFFGALILTFLMYRLIYPNQYIDFKNHLSIPLIGLNTFILISSSFLVVRSLESIREGIPKSLRNNLIGVLLLGALFLAGQAFEWITLFGDGVSIKTTFGTPFFVVTGIHGMHVFVGLIWCVGLLFLYRRRFFTQREHSGVEIFGLYWHFVDIVWIVLFTVIYLV